MRRRPDVIAAERRLAAADARVAQQLAEYYPKFSLSALTGTEAVSSGLLFTGAAAQTQGLMGLRWRLFDFARIDAAVDAARGGRAEALAAWRQSALRAAEDVESAFVLADRRRVQAERLQAQVRAQAAARQAVADAYASGAASLLEVLDADTRLSQAQDQAAQAEAGRARAVILTFRALGGS